MSRNLNPWTAIIATIALLTAPCITSAVLAQESGAGGDAYANGDYGRVRYQINGLTVRRSALNRDGIADVNSPVFPGDSITTGYDQRAEIELAGGAIIRIDRNSNVTFLALPSPYASFKDNIVLQLAQGSLRIDARIDTGGEFRIDTPDASIYLLGDGDFRIEVSSDGVTQAVSRRGVAEVVGAGGSVLVRGGMRTTVRNASVPNAPAPFNTFGADGFDRWVTERQSTYRYNATFGQYDDNSAAYDALPSEVRPYYGELSAAGTWTNSDEYGYVWSPSSVRSSWRPYSNGYWDYGPNGYFWISSDPWGWAPYHYGRWVWGASFGWGWTPGRVFGGAWVAWSWGSAYIGWAPLGYYNQPVYYGNYYYGYYDPYCWTFAGYGNIYHPYRGYDHGYRTADEIGDHLATNAVRTRPPDISPAELAGSPDARQRALQTVQSDTTRMISPLNADTRTRDSFVTVETRQRALIRAQPTPSLGRPESSTASTPPTVRESTSYPRRILEDMPPLGEAAARWMDPGRTRSLPSDVRSPTTYRRTSPAETPATRQPTATPSREQRKSLGSRVRTLFGGSREQKAPSASDTRSKSSTSRSKPSKTRSKPSKSRSKPSSSRSKPPTRSRSSSPTRSRSVRPRSRQRSS